MKSSLAAYKALLILLRGLMYGKRAFVACILFVWRGVIRLDEAYKRTIGFRIYKVIFYGQKRVSKSKILSARGLLDIMGERSVLQLVLLVTLIALALPQIKVYTEASTEIPGRNTLLYKLVGPGDQDFELVSETIIEVNTPITSGGELWREGAVVAPPTFSSALTGPYYEEIAGTAYGGQAVNKPIIIPGAEVTPGTVSGEPVTRAAIVLYEVKLGDVIGNIARNFGISIETILWANNLNIRSYIRPGDQLKILPVDGVTYKIARGDTISKIARLYGAGSDTIIAFNNLEADGRDIVVGEELIIPNGKKVGSSLNSLASRTGQAIRNTVFSKIVAPPPSITAPAGSGYLWPTAASIITQYFGWRHAGVDIAGKIGVPNYAAKAGRVVKSQCGWNGGYGCYIILDHGNGVQTLYGHNSKILVSVGEYVNQGQAISLLGSTGRSTGPHLHFEVHVNGRRLNPLQYVRR